MLLLLYLGKENLHPLRRLGGPQSQRTFWRKKNLLFLPEFIHQTIQPVAKYCTSIHNRKILMEKCMLEVPI